MFLAQNNLDYDLGHFFRVQILIPQIDYETGWPLPEVQQKLTELRLI
jgi:hypothetical protein